LAELGYLQEALSVVGAMWPDKPPPARALVGLLPYVDEPERTRILEGVIGGVQAIIASDDLDSEAHSLDAAILSPLLPLLAPQLALLTIRKVLRKGEWGARDQLLTDLPHLLSGVDLVGDARVRTDIVTAIGAVGRQWP